MSQEKQQQPVATAHFDAAKAIVDTLKGLDDQTRALAIRFASETLGIQTPAPAPAGSPTQASGSSAASPPGAGGPTHSTDIKQFTAAKSPKSDQQFAAVVAYFYRFEAPPDQRKESIDADTLQTAARLAGRNRHKNPRMTLTNAKNAGYLDSAGTGMFKISTVGENLVAMTLPGSSAENSPRRAGGKRRTTRQTRTKKPSKRGG